MILTAALFALIFKSPSDDDEELERDEEDYELAYDEEWLHPPAKAKAGQTYAAIHSH